MYSASKITLWFTSFSDLWQVGGLRRFQTCGRSVVYVVFRLAAGRWFTQGHPVPPPNWPPRYNWNNVESGVKHHQTNKQTVHVASCCLYCVQCVQHLAVSVVFNTWNIWRFLLSSIRATSGGFCCLQYVKHLAVSVVFNTWNIWRFLLSSVHVAAWQLYFFFILVMFVFSIFT
jgi:hypothetical protein